MTFSGIALNRLICGHEGMISGIAFSPSGLQLASSSLDSTIRIVNLQGTSAAKVINGHTLNVTALAWSPNGQVLASASDDRDVFLWQYPSLKPLGNLEKHPRGISRLSWSPLTNDLVTCSNDRRIRVFDADKKTIKTHLEGHVSLPRCVAFHPSGAYLASGSDEGTIRLWKGAQYAPDKVLYGHNGGINDLTWSPNGQLISCSDDGQIRIWNTGGLCLRELPAHDGPVKAIAISGNGSLLASKSWDQTLRIWRCDTWTTVAILEEDTAAPYPNLAFHNKEGWLASVGTVDRILRIWQLDMATLANAPESTKVLSFREEEAAFLVAEGLGDLIDVPRTKKKAPPAAPEPAAQAPFLGTRVVSQLTPPPPRSQPPAKKEAQEVTACTECHEIFTQAQIQRRISMGFDFITCPVCETKTNLGTAGPTNLTNWAGGRKLILAVVFTDIVDSTALATRLGNQAMKDLRHIHFERVRAAIKAHRGYEIKTIGDSFMAAFKTVGSGLDFAVDVLRNTGHPDVEIRAALHVGPVEVEENDLFGNMVNFCARLLGQVPGPELCSSEEAYSHIVQEGDERHTGLPWNAKENITFKGFPGTWRVWLLS